MATIFAVSDWFTGFTSLDDGLQFLHVGSVCGCFRRRVVAVGAFDSVRRLTGHLPLAAFFFDSEHVHRRRTPRLRRQVSGAAADALSRHPGREQLLRFAELL